MNAHIKSGLIAGAALVTMLPAPSFATCTRYADGLPVYHWEVAREKMRANHNGDAPAVSEAAFARFIAEAELCEQDSISYREYDARTAETQAQFVEAVRQQSEPQYSRGHDPIFCDPAPGGGFDCM